MFLKKKTKQFMKTSYREQPNGYLETIQKGIRAVRYFNRKMSYGISTREGRFVWSTSELQRIIWKRSTSAVQFPIKQPRVFELAGGFDIYRNRRR